MVTDLFPAGISNGRGPIGAFALGIDDCRLLLVKLDFGPALLSSLFENGRNTFRAPFTGLLVVRDL